MYYYMQGSGFEPRTPHLWLSFYELLCRVLRVESVVNSLFFQLQDLRSLDRLLDNFVLGAYIYFLTKSLGYSQFSRFTAFLFFWNPCFGYISRSRFNNFILMIIVCLASITNSEGFLVPFGVMARTPN